MFAVNRHGDTHQKDCCMQLSKFLRKPFFENRNLYYKLNIIFGLFFLFPIIGFIFFSIKYNMLEDEHLPFFFSVCSYFHSSDLIY